MSLADAASRAAAADGIFFVRDLPHGLDGWSHSRRSRTRLRRCRSRQPSRQQGEDNGPSHASSRHDARIVSLGVAQCLGDEVGRREGGEEDDLHLQYHTAEIIPKACFNRNAPSSHRLVGLPRRRQWLVYQLPWPSRHFLHHPRREGDREVAGNAAMSAAGGEKRKTLEKWAFRGA